jgi:hypothetical protein
MHHRLTRRSFVHLPAAGLVALLPSPAVAQPEDASAGSPGDWFPRQDPAIAQEFVGVSHGNLARVRELVEKQPALARSAVDWGFGDWETALGAAAHTGRREIAELLLVNGAQPTLFSAAMMGQLDVVRAFIESRPGIQGIPGPHGITLLSHARAGGAEAAPVLKYLESVGGADRRPATRPLAPAERDALVGRYRFGAGPRDHFDVDVQQDQLGIGRPEATRRGLAHTGDLVFFPAGVPTVKIAFARESGKVTRLTVADPGVIMTATRV